MMLPIIENLQKDFYEEGIKVREIPAFRLAPTQERYRASGGYNVPALSAVLLETSAIEEGKRLVLISAEISSSTSQIQLVEIKRDDTIFAHSYFSIEKSFVWPIGYEIEAGEKLKMKLYNYASSTKTFKWSFTGFKDELK